MTETEKGEDKTSTNDIQNDTTRGNAVQESGSVALPPEQSAEPTVEISQAEAHTDQKGAENDVLNKIEEEKQKIRKLKCCWISELIVIPILVVIIGLLGLYYLHLINSSSVEVVENAPTAVANVEERDTSAYVEGYAYSKARVTELKLSGDGQSVTISWKDETG